MSLLPMLRAPTGANSAVQQGLQVLGRQVQSAFQSQGLPAHLELRIQGPRTVTVVLSPISFNLQDANRVRRMEPVVEHILRLSPVRISHEAGRIYVEVPSPWPVPLAGVGGGFRLAGLQVGLGLTSRNAVAVLDMAQTPHVLMVGPTDAGKSTAARAMVYHLLDQSQTSRVMVITRRPGDWSGLAQPTPAAGAWDLVHHDEAEPALAWARQTTLTRERQGIVDPPVFVVVDDLLALLLQSKVKESLSDIASQGRGGGVHLILCTQRLGQKGAGDAVVTGNIRTRLVFGTADAQDAAMFTGRGDTGAEKLMGRGDCLLITPGSLQRVTVANVTPTDLGRLSRWPTGTPLAPWDPRLSPRPTTPTTATTPNVATVEGGDWGPEADETPLSVPPVVPVAPVAPVVRRLERRDPTPDEYGYIREVRAQLGNNEATCKALWGYKDGKSLGWLKLAMEDTR